MRTPHGIPHGATALNDQELAWAGEHGNAYNRRAPGSEEANYQLYGRIFGGIAGGLSGQFRPIDDVLELGAGTGANIRALSRLIPRARYTAVELNEEACAVIREHSPAAVVINRSVLEVDVEPAAYDLVLTKGLLIHIHPAKLSTVYRLIHRAARRWILLAEYYNPTRVGIPYRGQDNLLWKADFAGEMLDLFPDLRAVNYGFTWRRDRHPQDDITWFLLEKRGVVAPAPAEAATDVGEDPEGLNQC